MKFIHLGCNCIKLILQIRRLPFWVSIYIFLMNLFPPKLMINAMTLVLILHFFMAMFHVIPLMECIFFQLIRFASVCSYVEDFNACKLLNLSYRVPVLQFLFIAFLLLLSVSLA